MTLFLSSPSTVFCDRLHLLQASRILFQLFVCFIGPIIFVYNVHLAASLRNTYMKTPLSLPSPNQAWVHAVDSRKTLQEALQNDSITAIEADLLMGQTTNETAMIPIMAHPPNTQSDLSVTDFLNLMTENNKGQRTVQKVIKLDFKELETVEPTLKAIADGRIRTSAGTSAFFLNADILPGPGRREAVTIPASQFLETCLRYIAQSPALFAFSLGFKSDFTDPNGYTRADLQAMAALIEQYQLEANTVLAVNARQLAKSLTSFDDIMAKFPKVQILAWTGKGEPPIPQSLHQSIHDYFQDKNMTQRIGFDCQISPSQISS